jgi:hypothetical protein
VGGRYKDEHIQIQSPREIPYTQGKRKALYTNESDAKCQES